MSSTIGSATGNTGYATAVKREPKLQKAFKGDEIKVYCKRYRISYTQIYKLYSEFCALMALDMQARHRTGGTKLNKSPRKARTNDKGQSVSRDLSVDSNDTDRARESRVVDQTAAQNNDPDRAIKFNVDTSYVTVDTVLHNVPTLSASHFLPNVAVQLV